MRGILYEIVINKVISVLDVQFAPKPMSHFIMFRSGPGLYFDGMMFYNPVGFEHKFSLFTKPI